MIVLFLIDLMIETQHFILIAPFKIIDACKKAKVTVKPDFNIYLTFTNLTIKENPL